MTNADYNNHHSESWIAVDPKDSNHLVGMSKFFYDPPDTTYSTWEPKSREMGVFTGRMPSSTASTVSPTRRIAGLTLLTRF